MTSYYLVFTTILLLSILILLKKLIQQLYHQYYYWSNKSLPQWVGIPFLGTSWKLFFKRQTVQEQCTELYKAYPNYKYYGMMDLATPTVLVKDPELIKLITVKSFEHFPDHRGFVDENVDPIFGKNLFSLRGERWRQMRHTLSPSFTVTKMKFMFELVNRCGEQFVETLTSQSYNTKDIFTRYTNDVIATVAFGIDVNSMIEPDNEFYQRGKEVTNFNGFFNLLKFIFLRSCPRLSKLFGITFLSEKSSAFFQRIVKDNVEFRERNNILRPDMIHLLMEARDIGRVDIDDIVSQAFIFFLAGFETSSTLMCFCVHEIARDSIVQDKLREEILKEKDFGYESLARMKYLDQVVNEVLRLYPPVILLDRWCAKDYTLPPPCAGGKEVKVEAGTVILFPVWAMQRDRKYFDRPDEFRPERFQEDVDPYNYLPFGLGPRKCIGNRFALMECKILLVQLLKRFRLVTDGRTKHPLEFVRGSFSLVPDGGFWVELKKID